MLPIVRAHQFLVADAFLATAQSVEARGLLASSADGGGTAMLETAWHLLRQAAFGIGHWIETGYAQRPAVMVGLAGILLLPLLMIIGAVLYRKPAAWVVPSAEAIPDFGGFAAARIELEDQRSIVLPARRDFLQIGRQEDNDICIDDVSVQRYHAVIERADELGFIITDISGGDGNGLRINGQPCMTALLANGDTVEIGKARMRFATAA